MSTPRCWRAGWPDAAGKAKPTSRGGWRAPPEFPVPEGCRLIRLDNNEAPDVAAAALLDQVRSVLSGAPKAAVTATTATPR